MFLYKFSIILFVCSVYSSSLTNVANNDRFKRSVGFGQWPLYNFARYNEVMEYIQSLAIGYPHIVQMLDMGDSYEGRLIPCIRISSNLQQHTRPMILIDGGIHAREWISVTTALYLIKQLVENPNNYYMISDIDWLILPLVNPDGYEYSHTHDRMWRKTRSRGERCYGVDLNRNFDFHWMEAGSSNYECLENYAGSKPFSEPESRNFRDITSIFKNQIKLYITLHSYGPMILYPWSYRKHSDADNHMEHAYLGNLIRKAIAMDGRTNYTVGLSTDVFDTISGVSDDWVKGVLGVPLAFTIELPEGGYFKFDPPPTDILPVGHETFQGFKIAYQYIAQKYRRILVRKNMSRRRNRNNYDRLNV